MIPPGIAFSSLAATERWLWGLSKAASVGVLTISVPRAFIILIFSLLIFWGITMMQR
jgi:hypothetical protein